MLHYRRPPDGIFTGSPQKIESLYEAILRESGGQ
jgi:hypothetical protein